MSKMRILAVDDSALSRNLYAEALERRYTLDLAEDGRRGEALIRSAEHDLYLLDLLMPGRSGIELQALIRELHPEAAVIVVSQTESVDDALASFKHRPDEFLRKPVKAAELLESIERALQIRSLRRRVEVLEEELAGGAEPEPVLGAAPAMRRLWRDLAAIAERHPDATVLVTGESGTGKELAARFIHRRSARRRGPFVAVNCGLLDSNLAASELFGIERNVATGVNPRAGKIEVAQGGTLFLDEVAELSEENQVRLLRVVQERVYTRVGSHRELAADVRLVAATNRDLRQAVSAGRFREDLYYRLCVVPVSIPPLRERLEDVPEFAAHFMAKHGRALAGPAEPLAAEELAALSGYAWPGNVRQLENVILARLVTGRPISRRALEATAAGGPPAAGAARPGPAGDPAEAVPVLGRTFDEIEADVLARVLAACDGSVVTAARALKIGKTAFYAKIAKYGLRREE